MWVHLPQAGSISSLFVLPSVFQESFIKFPSQSFVHFLLSLIFFVALEVGVPYSCVLYLSIVCVCVYMAVDFCVFFRFISKGPGRSSGRGLSWANMTKQERGVLLSYLVSLKLFSLAAVCVTAFCV